MQKTRTRTKEAQDTVIAVDQLLQEGLTQALLTRETLRSLDEKEKKLSSDCNRKSQIARVFDRIAVSLDRELENIILKTKAWNDECIDLFESELRPKVGDGMKG